MDQEFYCPVQARTFIRTEEYRSPAWQEFYETFEGSCQAIKASQKYYHLKFHICKPKHQGEKR